MCRVRSSAQSCVEMRANASLEGLPAGAEEDGVLELDVRVSPLIHLSLFLHQGTIAALQATFPRIRRLLNCAETLEMTWFCSLVDLWVVISQVRGEAGPQGCVAGWSKKKERGEEKKNQKTLQLGSSFSCHFSSPFRPPGADATRPFSTNTPRHLFEPSRIFIFLLLEKKFEGKKCLRPPRPQRKAGPPPARPSSRAPSP